MDATLKHFWYDLMENNIVKFECQIKMFLYPSYFSPDVSVHFPLVCLRLPTMIYQTIIEFIEFLVT